MININKNINKIKFKKSNKINQFKINFNKIKFFVNSKPFLFVIIVYILHFSLNFLCYNVIINLTKPITNLIYKATLNAINPINFSKYEYFSNFLSPAICFIITLILGYTFIYKQKNFLKTLKLSSFLIILISINLIYTVIDGAFIHKYGLRNLKILLFFLIYYFCSAFSENTLTLGLTLNCFIKNWGFSKKKIWFSLTTTSLIFGCTRFINIFTIPQASFLFIVVQIIHTFSSYMYIGAVYLRGRSIWAIILCHTIFEFQIFEIFNAPSRSIEMWYLTQSPKFLDFLELLIISTCYLFLTWFLLKKQKFKEILPNIINNATNKNLKTNHKNNYQTNYYSK